MASTGFELAAIRPLVAHEAVAGRRLTVTFCCPVSQRQVNTTCTPPAPTALARRDASPSLWQQVGEQARLMLRALLGTTSLSRTAERSVGTAFGLPGTGAPSGLTSLERSRALMAAFRGVSHQFDWDGRRWVHASVAMERLGPLERQLTLHPIQFRFDKLLLARMLVQVARSDGTLCTDETSYLHDVLDADQGSLAALGRRPPLTRAELAEATPGGTRLSMLAAVYALALSDEHLHGAERDLMLSFAEHLELTTGQQEEARTIAQTWLLEQALQRAMDWGGHDTHARDQLVALGARIGMSLEQVERVEAKAQRRLAATRDAV